jgi:hypothetical protein
MSREPDSNDGEDSSIVNRPEKFAFGKKVIERAGRLGRYSSRFPFMCRTVSLQEIIRRRGRVVRIGLVVAVLCVVFLLAGCRRERAETIMPAPESQPAALVDPWKEAALEVEQDRGEPTGRQAVIEVPAQLKHYADRRRFLAIQVAEWRRSKFQTPHDFAELADLIIRGDLVEMSPLGQDYILYGVGYSAPDEPFTHYDKETGQSVTLYGGDAELEQEYGQLAESLRQIKESLDTLGAELKGAPKTERALQKELREEIAEKGREQKAILKRKELLDSFYKKPAPRQLLASEYATLAALAGNFQGRSYDLQDAAAHKAFKVRMLSFIRPEALKVLEEIARAYREKFDRHLPITSLVRPDEYQRQLHETNPNATLIDVPPHTTGLAFDIFNRYMTAAEQSFLMGELARMRDEGRIEALRENRDHFHVFAFANGRPPDESLIRRSLGEKADPSPDKKAQPASNKSARADKKTRVTRAKR